MYIGIYTYIYHLGILHDRFKQSGKRLFNLVLQIPLSIERDVVIEHLRPQPQHLCYPTSTLTQIGSSAFSYPLAPFAACHDAIRPEHDYNMYITTEHSNSAPGSSHTAHDPP